MKIASFVFFFCLMFASVLTAQQDITDFDKITTKKGLSNNAVTCILEDRKGYVWFGTNAGLNRYSGYGFDIFSPSKKDSMTLADKSINSLFEDKRGNIWIGTDNGLSVFMPDLKRFKSWQNNENYTPLTNNTVSSITEDKTGKLWIATFNGITVYDPEKNAFSVFSGQLSNNQLMNTKRIEKIHADSHGNIWIGTLRGLFVFDPIKSTFEHFHKDTNGFPDNFISTIFEDRDKNIWVGTRGGIVLFERGKNLRVFKHDAEKEHSVLSNLVNDIDEDIQGNIWTATDLGVAKLDKKSEKFTNYYFEKSGEKITSIFADNAGIVWCGTAQDGVYKLDPFKYKFAAFSLPEKHPEIPQIVWAVAADKDANTWLGSGYGLFFKHKSGEFSFSVGEKNAGGNLASKNISSISPAQSGGVWVGTFKNGFAYVRYDEKSRKFNVSNYKSNPLDDNSLAFDAVRCIHQDKKGVLWIGTLMGLSRAKPDENGIISSFDNFFSDDEPANGLSDNSISVIHEDSGGNIWIATAKGVNAVAESDGKTVFKSFPALEKVQGKIQTLATTENELWIGTNSGLYRFDLRSHQFELVEEEDIFFNLSVVSLAYDNNSYLWAGTNDGLFRIHKKNLKIKFFGLRDGLPSLEFTPNAAYVTANNEIYFGTRDGYVLFESEKVLPNGYKPKIVFTDFKLFNSSVPFGSCSDTMNYCLSKHIDYLDEITLSYRDYVFSIDFLALGFRNSEKNEYAFKLEGFDKHWNYVGTNKSATYSSLPAGEYLFMVKAANSEGIWSDEPRVIRVIVMPPFWQTYWFIFLVILFIALLIYAVLKLRIITIEARNRALEILVKEHTVEIIDKNFELEKQKHEVVRAYENVRTLNEIGRKITSSLNFSEVVETIYQNLNSILDANGFGIGIYIPELNVIRFDSFIESGKRLEGRDFDIRNDVYYYPVICFLRKKSIFITDLEKQHEQYSDRPYKIIRGETPQSFIYVPLYSKGKINGVITVQSFQKNAYTDYQLNLLESLATYISTALDNAKAYSQIEKQKIEIEENSKNLRDSINYAKRIQTAMLPEDSALASAVGDAFIFLMPRDVVSGDFFWYSEIKENNLHKIVVAAVDCTGHGVPGAFMSMTGHAYLNQIVNVQKILSPDVILSELHKNLTRALQKSETNNRDGMDAAICIIDKKDGTLEFSGAKNPLVWIKDNEVQVIKGSKESIGESTKNEIYFEKHKIGIESDATYYIFTDGYEDQFGGALGRKILRKNFYELLRKVNREPLGAQKKKLSDYFIDWKGNSMQIDDVLVIGFRVT